MKLFQRHSEYFRKTGLVALSGILSVCIFPSYNIEILAWIAFVPLFAAIEHESLTKAFWLGWIAGCIHFLGTLYWVTVTMVLYGNLSKFFSGVALLLLVMYLALYIAIFCLLLRFLHRYTTIPLLISAPVLWVGLEYLRSFFIIGFPWNFLGYSQFLTPQVTQIADITGVYGVSFLIIFVNAGLYTLLNSDTLRITKVRTVIAMLCFVGFCIGYSLIKLPSANAMADNVSSDEETSERVKIAVVQGNIDQNIKWDREHRQQIFDTYVDLSRKVLDEKPDMIVWPETAVPFVFQYDPVYKKQLLDVVRNLHTFLLFGGLDIVPVSTPERYHSLNSAFLLSPEGDILAKYDKILLVPFGEYVPFEKLLFFVERITTAIGKVRPGKTFEVMTFKQIPFSTVICFEVIFPNLVRKFVDRGAQFLLTITNDAWFGKTSASYQHFAMVTFRAIENRVAFARSANTGISGFIDPYGRILDESDIFVEDALVHDIPLRETTTFYTRYGDIFARLCFALSLCWTGYIFFKKKTRQHLDERVKVQG